MKKYHTLDNACLRPDLDAMCESRTFQNSEGLSESEYCFSTETLPENTVIMFLGDQFCGRETVKIEDAPIEDGWCNYFMAEVAAMRRLVHRFESSQPKGDNQ